MTSVPPAHSEDLRRVTASVPRWHSSWLSISPLARDIQRLAPRLRAGRLLDIACGNKPYRSWFPQATWYLGLDIVPANSSADVVAHTAQLPFAAEVFDSALCTQALEHVARPDALLAEAWRVLKPNGQLLLSAPMYWQDHEEPYDFYRYTRHGLQFLLAQAGFEIEYLVQQGGAWRVVGQAFANTFYTGIRFRTFGVRALVLLLANTFFDLLDRVNYQTQDTCNLVVLARKI